jgi:JAB domain-containing protein similar to deubiquitination enzymes
VEQRGALRAHLVRAGLVAASIVAVLAIRPQIVQPVQPGERGPAPRAAPLRASTGRAATAAPIPVHALVLSEQARRYLELQYRSYPTEFMGCMIGTVERGTVLVERIAPADVEPAGSTPTRVIPTQSCEAAGWSGTVGVVHSHPAGQNCWYLFPGTVVPTSDAASFRLQPYPVDAIMCGDHLVWIGRDMAEEQLSLLDSRSTDASAPAGR